MPEASHMYEPYNETSPETVWSLPRLVENEELAPEDTSANVVIEIATYAQKPVPKPKPKPKPTFESTADTFGATAVLAGESGPDLCNSVLDPELFYIERENNKTLKKVLQIQVAKAVCGMCVSKDACFETADESAMVFGGVTSKEREALQRLNRRT